MTFWSLSFVCKMCRPPLGDPLKFSVIVVHSWRHLQYYQESLFLMSLAFDNRLAISCKHVPCFCQLSQRFLSVNLKALFQNI